MKILAIDFGTKRLGIAIGDTETGIAFPREILKNSKTAFAEILLLSRQEEVKKIIVGLPILLSSRETSETENARMFADSLEDFFLEHDFHIPIDYYDERFSSKSAADTMKILGKSERDFRGKTDSSAAAIFLQVYFDAFRQQ